jgi:phenylacetic acid degradation operon negative regulatory protein
MIEPARAILGLLSAAPGQAGQVAILVRAAEVLGIRGNAVRVALARLKKRGLVESPERGLYKLGAAAGALQAHISRWREAGGATRAWAGGWIAAHTAGLDRSDRAQLRRRERALRLLGLAEATRGLFLRPDNLTLPLPQLRSTLIELGCEAPIFRATDVPETLTSAAIDPWNPDRLTASYRYQSEALEAARIKIATLDPGPAAALSFVVGDAAIREIVADPLLPAPYVDAAARRAFFDAMRDFDVLGRQLWARILMEATS